MGAIWLNPEASGERCDASSKHWHAEFVTESTSDLTRGGAVRRPHAIISLQTCPANGLDLCLAGLFYLNLKIFKIRAPRTRRLAPTGAGSCSGLDVTAG